MIREQPRSVPHGLLALPFVLLGQLTGIAGIIVGARVGPWLLVPAILITLAFFVATFGFFIVGPNEGRGPGLMLHGSEPATAVLRRRIPGPPQGEELGPGGTWAERAARRPVPLGITACDTPAHVAAA